MNACHATGDALEFDISGLEAMLAGTLCLMSAYSHCDCGNLTNQGLIGMKIVSNLSCLQAQNALSPEFRRVLGKVCESWRQHSLMQTSPPPEAAPTIATHTSLWHATPKAVQ